MTTHGDIKTAIRTKLNIDDPKKHVLDEAYVAATKTFAQQSTKLSSESKTAHADLYEKYVEKFNETSAMFDGVDVKQASSAFSAFRSLARDNVFNMNSVYLHELFFANMGDLNSMLFVDSLPYMRLERDFGNINDWQSNFIAHAMSSREGWIMTCFSTYLKRYINVTVDSHDSGVPVGCYPVIVVDMWTHTYYDDFKNDKRAYIRSMMREFNWTIIENRFERAEKIAEVVR